MLIEKRSSSICVVTVSAEKCLNKIVVGFGGISWCGHYMM